jgi:hypothetical protein
MTSKIETFLRTINDAFARGDTAFVIDNVADDIRWTMIGEPVVAGKAAFVQAMSQPDVEPPQSLTLDSLILQGTRAVLEGTMTMNDGSGIKTYGYCDVYELTDAEEPKIRVLRSYVVETNAPADA